MDIALLLIVAAVLFRPADWVKVSVLAVSAFCLLYVICSGLLFWIDQFSFKRALAGVFVLSAAGAVCGTLTELKAKRSLLDILPVRPTDVLPFVLAVVTLFMTAEKFELYHNGQDQGLYQAEAIELYMGNFEVVHSFEEFQILEREEDIEAYREMLRSTILGYYPLSGDYASAWSDRGKQIDVTSGMYHGVQTFPAILALGGRLFGLENMMQVQTVFLICSVLLIYYMLRNMGLSRFKSVAALSVFALSPLVLWISKTSFTEMILTLCYSLYLFLLTEQDTPQKRLLLSLPLVGFCFVHVSALLLYPVFLLAFVMLYLHSGKREYLWANVIMAVGLFAGYTMMGTIAPKYFFDNLRRLYFGSLITRENILYWVYAGALFTALVPLLLLPRLKNGQALYQKILSLRKAIPWIIALCGLVMLYRVIVTGYFTEPPGKNIYQWYGTGFINALGHTSFLAFCMATGGGVLIMLLWHVASQKKDELWSSPNKVVIWMLFLYCVLLQGTFFRPIVWYYYYYSRYLVFYIPIIAAAFGILLSELKNIKPWIAWSVSVALMLMFDAPLLTHQDLTTMEWENVFEVQALIPGDAAVVLSHDAAQYMGPQIRALTGAAIFPAFEDLEREFELLEKHYPYVYFLNMPNGPTPDYVTEGPFRIIYKDRTAHNEKGITMEWYFPIDYPESNRVIEIYRYQGF